LPACLAPAAATSSPPCTCVLQFEEKLLEVVQSSENFISELYRGGVSTMHFPTPTDSRFYRELARLAGGTIACVEQPFESGLQLTGYMRRLLAKLAHKDWWVATDWQRQ
jgi:hypothetical protein